jgi:hypothetical protein
MTCQNRGTGLLGPGRLSTGCARSPEIPCQSGDHFLEAGPRRSSPTSRWAMARRRGAGRRLSGVEQNFSADCSRKGKCEKAQVFQCFVRSRPGRKRVVTAKPRSLDATPAQHNRGGSAHFSDNRCAVLTSASAPKPRSGRLPPFFLPDMGLPPPNFVSLRN